MPREIGEKAAIMAKEMSDEIYDELSGDKFINGLVDSIRTEIASDKTTATQTQDAAPGEAVTMQIQLSAPTNAPKTTKWSRDQIAFALLVGGVVFTLLACVAAWLVVPQVQEVISSFVRGAIPTLTPTPVSPVATP